MSNIYFSSHDEDSSKTILTPSGKVHIKHVLYFTLSLHNDDLVDAR